MFILKILIFFVILLGAYSSFGGPNLEFYPNLQNWKEKSFKGNTKYIEKLENGKRVLEASSKGTASALIFEKEINIKKYPYMNWSWKVLQPIYKTSEKSKSGDDFPVRLYVMYSGFLGLGLKAVNYVWTTQISVGETWRNPFTNSAIMVASDGGRDAIGKWRHLSANVYSDFQDLFGRKFTKIKAIAVMTDSDNSKKESRGLYGPISFSKRPKYQLVRKSLEKEK